MDTKGGCFILGAKAFFSGVFRGNCALTGWRATHWRRGWDAAHDGDYRQEK